MEDLLQVGIIGASGYTGAELLRLLAGHPEVEVTYVTANTYEGQPVEGLYPHLQAFAGMMFRAFQPEEALDAADFHFIALPHGEAMRAVEPLLNGGARVVDLSADHRLDSAESYSEWYGLEHSSPELLSEAAYGLPELFPEPIAASRLVAVPGCYPTAVLLALAPLLEAGVIEPEGLIADAKSGVSGAGRSLSLGTHFAQCNENISAYNLGGHRHQPEMELYLARVATGPVSLVFAPHLVPMNRGILATCYGRMHGEVTTTALLDIANRKYAGSPFVHVLPEGQLPQTKAVQGSNQCHIGLVADAQRKIVMAVSAIDNLVKGASGAAVQCMNLMAGLPPTMGLGAQGLFP
jgi:N-acetyl-gamma-glutamyl-phosphate reductase